MENSKSLLTQIRELLKRFFETMELLLRIKEQFPNFSNKVALLTSVVQLVMFFVGASFLTKIVSLFLGAFIVIILYFLIKITQNFLIKESRFLFVTLSLQHILLTKNKEEIKAILEEESLKYIEGENSLFFKPFYLSFSEILSSLNGLEKWGKQ